MLEQGTEAIRQMASAVELAAHGGDQSARQCAVLARVAIDQFLQDLDRRRVTIPAPDTIPVEADNGEWIEAKNEDSTSSVGASERGQARSA